MPIREACHVAVQKIHPRKQRLWKHAQARQLAKGQALTPVLQIVCIILEFDVLLFPFFKSIFLDRSLRAFGNN